MLLLQRVQGVKCRSRNYRLILFFTSAKWENLCSQNVLKNILVLPDPTNAGTLSTLLSARWPPEIPSHTEDPPTIRSVNAVGEGRGAQWDNFFIYDHGFFYFKDLELNFRQTTRDT